MYVTTKIRMDLTRPDTFRQVACVQGDMLTRRVEIELMADGECWNIPQGTTVIISYQDPSGTSRCYDQLPDGEVAWDISGNLVGVLLDPGIMAQQGITLVQLKLLLEDTAISTFAFQVRVVPGLAPGDDPERSPLWKAVYLPQAENVSAGEYLYVTEADEDGHVVALEGKIPQIPQALLDRVTAVEDASAENAADLAQITKTVEALERFAAETSTLESRVESLEGVANQYPRMIQRITALENHEGSDSQALTVLDQRVTALESTESGYPECWEPAIQRCIDAIHLHQETAGRPGVTFAWFSNNCHRGGYAGALIRKIMDECGVPVCFYGGDAINSDPVEDISDIEQQQADFDRMMAPISREKDCRALGDQDYLRNQTDGRMLAMSDGMVYDRYFRKQATAGNKEMPFDGRYYYLDDTVHHVRYIVLNSVWMDPEYDTNGSVLIRDGFGFGQEQLEWLAGEALIFENNQWSVVLITHCPLTGRDADIAKGIVIAFMTNSKYTGTYESTVNSNHNVDITVDFRFAENADMIGWFCGHNEVDHMNTTGIGYDLTLTEVGIKADGSGDGSPEETASGHAIDFVTIDKEHRMVYLTRLGDGEDRSYDF